MTETIITQDYNKVKRIIFKNPNLMSGNAEQQIKDTYNSIINIKKEIAQWRQNIREAEAKLNELNEFLKSMSGLYEVEYETIKKEVTTEKAGFIITGLGNYSLGQQKMM